MQHAQSQISLLSGAKTHSKNIQKVSPERLGKNVVSMSALCSNAMITYRNAHGRVP